MSNESERSHTENKFNRCNALQSTISHEKSPSTISLEILRSYKIKKKTKKIMDSRRRLETDQDFCLQMDIKPRIHLVEKIDYFSGVIKNTAD